MSDASCCRKRKRLKYTFIMHFNVLRDDYIPRTAKCTSNGALRCEKKRLSLSQMKIYQREKSNINTLLKWKQKKKAKMKNELQKKIAMVLTRFLPNECVLL